jgi:hypothetical protein
MPTGEHLPPALSCPLHSSCEAKLCPIYSVLEEDIGELVAAVVEGAKGGDDTSVEMLEVAGVLT